MTLKKLHDIDLPEHVKPEGFDHAAVHTRLERLYVAHTANDAVDVIDCARDIYLHSIPNLIGVAGTLVAEDDQFVFTSNRGENTVGIFRPDADHELVRINVGIRPNGLAYDPKTRTLLAAHVGDPTVSGSQSVVLIDVDSRLVRATLPVAGRTRWAVFDARSNNFYVNIADPAVIEVIDAARPDRIARSYSVPVSGPHGLDIDSASQRLFCACDGGQLVVLDAESGSVLNQAAISGVPDVVFFNEVRQHLYVAVGNPGVIDVFDTNTLQRIETVNTEMGAHTLGFDPAQNKVYAFLPQTHRAVVYLDEA